MTYLQVRRLRIGFNGRLELAQTTMITVRILLVSVLTAVVARILWSLLDHLFGVSFVGQLFSVGIAVIAAGAFYVWGISHMRIPEWEQIESMFARRLAPLGTLLARR
jgi:heme/copper-type cytochrome/quinol oxidase subunit 1